jgi:hypothetical protein
VAVCDPKQMRDELELAPAFIELAGPISMGGLFG